MDSQKHYQDQQSDTGIGLTPDEFLIKPSNLRDMPNTTSKENVALTGTEVSDVPFISLEDASPRPIIIEISSSKITDITEENTRSRTLTAKGREYQSGLKKTAALSKDRELHARLSSFEELVHSGQDTSKIKTEITVVTKEVNDALRLFDEWIELSDDPTEIQRATEKQAYLLDTWKSIRATAANEIKKVREDNDSVFSQKSRHSRKSSLSSGSSHRDTLINVRAKRVALEEKLKFSTVIAEQEKKLEQLKIQRKLGEVRAQEAVYQKAVEEEDKADDFQSPLLPTKQYDPIPAFLRDNNEGLTSTPEVVPSVPQNFQAFPTASASPMFTSPTSNTVYSSPHTRFSLGTQVPLTQYTTSSSCKTVYTSTNTRASFGSNVATTFATPHTDRPGLTSSRGFCGNPPVFIPSPDPVQTLPPQDYLIDFSDTITRLTQLQRLPQAKPDVFKGDEQDQTKFFLWENAFDSLIDSIPITAQQKLHLLYQYLDGKAKRVIEQLQYLVQDPDSAYKQARTILKERFGHPAIISTSFEKRLANWPKIPPYDAAALEEFSDFLYQVQIASQHMSGLGVLNYPSQIQSLVEKLPAWFKNKWSDKVLKLQKSNGKDAFPSFKDFVQEVRYHAERTNIPQITLTSGASSSTQSDRSKNSNRTPRKRSAGSALTSTRGTELDSEVTSPVELNQTSNVFATEAQKPDPSTPAELNAYCFYHKMKSHAMTDCEQFQKLSYEERKDFLLKNRICLKCVSSNEHVSKDCKRDKLECKICKQMHATILHDPTRHKKKDTSQSNSACSQVCGQGRPARSCARIVLIEVFHQDNPSVKVPTYAVLDDQSTDVFITEPLLEKLRVEGQEVNLEINTITGLNSVRTKKVNGLRIQDTENRHKSIKIPFAYSQENIPASQRDIATPEIARSWKHLEEIACHIHYRPDVEIGLLIGRNIPSAFQPLRIIYGSDNEPWAEEYKFGWTIIGPVCVDKEEETLNCASVNRITVQSEYPQNVFTVPTSNRFKEESIVSFATRQHLKDVTSPQQIREMMQLDYSELYHARNTSGTEKGESVEDKRFSEILATGIHKNDLGNWEMPLPFKADTVSLPNNREQCLKRLLGIKRKFLRNGELWNHYTEFMQNLFDRNHASAVPSEELKTEAGKVWFLPHFDIYHPKKPDQIRIVFDCSAVFDNQSLNKLLLQGPDMMNALIGVLSRFRKEEIAVTCDIEKMFHSFYVNPEHRDYLRFLWFKDNNLDGQIIEYRMNVHLFGAVSSPGVANFGLRMTAEAGRRDDFYVDDGLKSFDTPENAIKVIKKTQAMCATVNVRLHKFASNSKTVLEALPVEDRSKNLKDLDLRHDILPVLRSLGTYWCIESDTIGFCIQLKDKPLTRRGILSTVSSVYDPLGIVAPVILVGKQLLQELCRDGIDWDDPVPDHIHSRWEKWRSELPLLENIRIPRCVKPCNFGEPVTTELHSFSDASDVGLGQVTYLRLVNNANQVHVSLLMGKARVAPLKSISIPRRELTAAVISVNVASMLSRDLNYFDLVKVFYTDSSVVLGYIRNEARRYHTYVSNRVQQIRDSSDPTQWLYVSSSDNPADIAS